ncbi:hypothetical protein [Xanthomonas translucens]|uniref:hypothetical protein n=1 Tax=Xanthomonas campestris pv. translucens TaxID=343 RepID=UPI0027145565|nr:hypothetical protein [Xanthomonas translucens]WLA01302.1 hypothetical protein MO330_01470 [Xanthomonas translucens]
MPHPYRGDVAIVIVFALSALRVGNRTAALEVKTPAICDGQRWRWRNRARPFSPDATARHLANRGQTDWAAGAVSTDRAMASAFAVVDELLAVVADPKRYPHLRQITITGFGRGAEWVLRHATASAAPEALARLNQPLQLNWVVASPDRYTYLDSSRWDAKRHAFTDRNAGIANGSEACRTLDDYPYGYRGAVPDYVASGLNAADRHDIAGRFLQRSVI